MKDQFLTSDYRRIGFFFFIPSLTTVTVVVRCYDDVRRRSSCIVALVQRFFSLSLSLLSPFISHVLSTDYTYAIGSFIFVLIVRRSLLRRGAENRIYTRVCMFVRETI